MICFRDMTFCSAYSATCVNHDCRRAVTSEIRESARRWWGGDDAPFAMSDLSSSCSIFIPVAET